jgi:hypothetical protein
LEARIAGAISWTARLLVLGMTALAFGVFALLAGRLQRV